jgi:hypothetical protein
LRLQRRETPMKSALLKNFLPHFGRKLSAFSKAFYKRMQMKLDALLSRSSRKTFSIKITAKRHSFDHCQIRFLLMDVAGT